MIHVGKRTSSTIVSKGISAGHGQNTYRGLVKILKSAENARNFSQCDSMLIGDQCGAHTFPYIDVQSSTAKGFEADIASCVAGVIKTIQFPAPGDGGSVQVNYPFRFHGPVG